MARPFICRGHGLRVAVGSPDLQPRGLSVRVPIGVGHERWGEICAWDQAVGIAAGDRHPVAEAVDGWLHNVFAVFAAMVDPRSDLAQRAYTRVISDGTRTADVIYGALAIRDFGGLGDDGFTRIADHLPWEGHGSVKSWALVSPH